MLQHTQYAVGQGGFHLGIIDKYAYVYDCGGDINVNWSQIFADVSNKLFQANVDTLDVFISHLHKDHYSGVVDLISFISNIPQKINIYMPPINDIEKIMLICEYHSDNISYSDENLDDEYIQLVLNGKFANLEENKKIHYVSSFSDKYIGKEIILRSYTTGTSLRNQKKFENELKKQNINIADLKTEIKKYGAKFWKIVIVAFKNAFKTRCITNHIMLNLYCGISYPCCCKEKINWLHTGDAYMKTYKQLEGFNQAFDKLLGNVNFAQIPHHGSNNNHDNKFSYIFNCCCTFYYTTQKKTNGFKGIVNPNVNNLCLLPCRKILSVSDNPSTQISI